MRGGPSRTSFRQNGFSRVGNTVPPSQSFASPSVCVTRGDAGDRSPPWPVGRTYLRPTSNKRIDDIAGRRHNQARVKIKNATHETCREAAAS